MAEYDQASIFAPQPAAPAQGPQPDGGQVDVAGQWRDWLANPDNRAAMMQFGIAMMQPVGLGQTPLGHTGQALGQAGEATSRRLAEQRAQQESDTRATLRTSQAQLAEARAGTAGATANLAQQRLEMQQRLGIFQRQIQASNAYRAAVKQMQDANIIAPRGQQQPIPSQEEWYARNGYGDLLQPGGGAGATAGGDSIPPPVGAGPVATPNAAAIDMLKRNPALAPQFDQRYGAGSAQRYLGSQ